MIVLLLLLLCYFNCTDIFWVMFILFLFIFRVYIAYLKVIQGYSSNVGNAALKGTQSTSSVMVHTNARVEISVPFHYGWCVV